MIEKHFELWNLRQEKSTEEKDVEKFNEECDELKRALMDGIRDLDDGVYEEVADVIIMAIALLFWTYKPKSREDAEGIWMYCLEFIESKIDRQMERWNNRKNDS